MIVDGDDSVILEMTPKRKIDLWKKDESNAEHPLVIMGYGALINVSPVGAMIWEMCNAQTKVSDIVDAICSRFPAEPKLHVQQDVIEFLQEFDKKDLLVLNYDPLG